MNLLNNNKLHFCIQSSAFKGVRCIRSVQKKTTTITRNLCLAHNRQQSAIISFLYFPSTKPQYHSKAVTAYRFLSSSSAPTLNPINHLSLTSIRPSEVLFGSKQIYLWIFSVGYSLALSIHVLSVSERRFFPSKDNNNGSIRMWDWRTQWRWQIMISCQSVC